MDINELPDFLSSYKAAMARKRGLRRYHIEISTEHAAPFFLMMGNEFDADCKVVHQALTLSGLIERMKKDIDETP